MKRYSRGKFGRIEEAIEGEFVYFIDHKDSLFRQDLANYNQTNKDTKEWSDLIMAEILVSKKLRIGMWLALSSTITLGLLLLQAKGVI